MTAELARHYLRVRGPVTGRAVIYAVGDAGAGTGAWKPLLAPLAARDIELRAVRLPGRENRMSEKLLETVDAQVADIVANMLPIVASDPRPFVLAGACSGATVAYEVAREMESHGHDPALLVAISQQSPLSSEIAVQPKDGMSREQLREWFAGQGSTPSGMGLDEMFDFMEPMLRADIRAFETYEHRAEPRLRCAVVTVRGRADDALSARAMTAWSDVTDGAFRAEAISGDHQLLRSAPSELTDVLEAAVRADRIAHVRGGQ